MVVRAAWPELGGRIVVGMLGTLLVLEDLEKNLGLPSLLTRLSLAATSLSFLPSLVLPILGSLLASGSARVKVSYFVDKNESSPGILTV